MPATGGWRNENPQLFCFWEGWIGGFLSDLDHVQYHGLLFTQHLLLFSLRAHDGRFCSSLTSFAFDKDEGAMMMMMRQAS